MVQGSSRRERSMDTKIVAENEDRPGESVAAAEWVQARHEHIEAVQRRRAWEVVRQQEGNLAVPEGQSQSCCESVPWEEQKKVQRSADWERQLVLEPH